MAKASEYDRKRSFERTPEPPGSFDGDVDPAVARTGTHFVIQQHYATRLHHDVRLEMLNGDTPVLVSWAVPKGLPLRSKGTHPGHPRRGPPVGVPHLLRVDTERGVRRRGGEDLRPGQLRDARP